MAPGHPVICCGMGMAFVARISRAESRNPFPDLFSKCGLIAGRQPAQPGGLFDNGKRRVPHFFCSCVAAKAQSDRRMDLGAGKTQSLQDVGRFNRRGGACGTGGECHVVGQGDDQGFADDGWDAYVEVSGKTVAGMPIKAQIRNSLS